MTTALLGLSIAMGQAAKPLDIAQLKQDFNVHKNEVRALFIWAPS